MSDFLSAARWTDKQPEPHQMAAWNWAWEQLTKEQQQEFLVMFRAAPKPKPAASPYQALSGLLALIRKGEGNYESVNRGRAGDTPGGWKGLMAMTLKEIMAAQAANKVFAVGAYQFIPGTLKEAVKNSGLSVSMHFSQEVQDWLAITLLLGGWKRPGLTAYLRGQSADLDAAQDELAYEWASLPNSKGRGWYDNDSAGNRAHGDFAAVRAALATSRQELSGRGIEALAPPRATPLKPAQKPSPAAVKPADPFSTKLTPHVTLGEFALYQEARRFKTQYQVKTAIELAEFLEKCRAHFGGKPVIITSGYRPAAVNKAVGGASNSEHLFSGPDVGAVDFFIDGVSVKAVQDWCDKEWQFSLGYGAARGFVHLGIRAGRPRVRWNY